MFLVQLLLRDGVPFHRRAADGREELLEYGHRCLNGHLVCFKCFLGLMHASGQTRTLARHPRKCPTCREYTAQSEVLPGGIIREGGIKYEPETKMVHYFMRGEEVAITRDDYFC